MRGFKERGTTTTPFDMVMLNDLDRFHLVIDVIDRVDGLANRAAVLRQRMLDARLAARRYTREHGEDDPQIYGLDLGLRLPRRRRCPRTRSVDDAIAGRLGCRCPTKRWQPRNRTRWSASSPHCTTSASTSISRVVVVVLALTNLIAHFTTPWASIATVPAAAVGLLLLVRSRGLGWAELGLGREHWKVGRRLCAGRRRGWWCR